MGGVVASLGGTLLGSVIGGKSQEKAAGAAANAQVEAARIAAEESRFRPVGMATAFGRSSFGYDENGRVNSLSYSTNPRLEQIRERMLYDAEHAGLNNYGYAFNTANQMNQGAQGLFGLAGQALPQSYDTQAAAQNLYNQQRQMLAPQREQQLAELRNNAFQTGRTGLSVGSTNAGYTQGGPGLQGTNPEMAAYYNALAQQDASLLNNSQQTARSNLQQDINTGINLYSQGGNLVNSGYGLQTAGLGPLQSLLGVAKSAEDMALQSVEIGAQLGGRNVNATGANALLQGGIAAANTNLRAGQNNADALAGGISSFGNALSNIMGGLSNSGGGGGFNYTPGSLFGGGGSSMGNYSTFGTSSPFAAPPSASFNPFSYGS